MMKPFLCLILFISLLQTIYSQILAVDFGTQFVKSAVVNSGTGKSFSIVHNSKSQRKFLNSIGFYSNQRLYQDQSLPKRSKLPTNCFIYTKLLIDAINDGTLPSKIKKDLLLQYIKEEEKDQLIVKFILQKFTTDNNQIKIIQVVAMILKYAKVNAQNQIKTPIKDVILTVPNYWNLKMRQFLTQAAQIADLYVLSLISQNTGAAINYALNQRSKNITQKILFFNLGSNSLQMTLAQFKQVAQEKGKPTQSIFILADYGKSYIGGLRFDQIVYRYFVNKFQKKYNRQLSGKGKIKMIIQANKVKEVLSANKQGMLFIQGLMDGIDYIQKITRSQFQQMSKQLFQQIVSPIKGFLFDNDLKCQDIDGIELIGGSIRIPKIQNMIQQIIEDRQKMGTHINGDQAMVLGGAFYGANSSKKFKVKGIHLYDGFNFQIRAVIKNLDQTIQQDDERYIFKNVTVFKKKSRFGITKQINFRSKQNIILQLYKQDDSGLQLLRANKFDTIQKVEQQDFKISLTLSLDPLKVVYIKTSQITYKKDQIQSYVQKVKKYNNNKQDSDEVQQEKTQNTNQQKEQQIQNNEDQQNNNNNEDQQNKDNENQQNKDNKEQQNKDNEDQQNKDNEEQQNKDNVEDKQNETQQQQKKQKKQKKQKRKKKQKKQEYQTVERNKTVSKKYERQLKTQQTYNFEVDNKQMIQQSKKVLKQYEQREEKVRKLGYNKNKLQSLIYQGRQKLQNSQFLQFTQQSQIQKLQELIKQKSQWLDYTISQDISEYQDHIKTLNKPLQKIKRRINEFNKRELSRKNSLKSLQEYKNLTNKIRQKKQWISQEQVDILLQKIQIKMEQLDEMYTKMQQTQKNENPVYLIKDFQKLVQKAKDQYFKLMSTQKPKKQNKENDKQKQQYDDIEDEL